MSNHIPGPLPLSRREALRRILAAAALASVLDLPAFGSESHPGIGGDPNLLKKEIPWPRLLTDAEKRSVTALADLILPADEFGPAASTLGVPDFIDEWVSAPYEQQQAELKTVRAGLQWLDAEAQQRHAKVFSDSSLPEQTALVEEILRPDTNARKQAYSFFKLFRDRAAGGYYTTPEGWKALGYVGNVPQLEFAGPSAEVLAHLGL